MTKTKLIASLVRGLENHGYIQVVGKTAGAFAHVFKATCLNGLVLNLGIHSSRFFHEAFTGSFYLGPTFTWSYLPPTYPLFAYSRLGRFLNADERERFLPSKFTKAGVVDAWWMPYSETSVSNFLEVVALVEERFLEQADLASSVLESDDMQEHLNLVKTTIKLAKREALQHLAPSDLESYALLALTEICPKRANDRVVAWLALDVYRCIQHRVQ